MLFGPVLKELQAPQGIPTLDGEHSQKAGNIHIRQGTFTWGGEHSHRVGIPKNLAGNNYIFIREPVRIDVTIFTRHYRHQWPSNATAKKKKSTTRISLKSQTHPNLARLAFFHFSVETEACIVVPRQFFGNPCPMWMFPLPHVNVPHLMWMFPVQCWDSSWSLYLLQNWTKQHETGINRKRNIRSTRLCNQNLNWVTFGLCILKMVHFLMWTTIYHIEMWHKCIFRL